MAPSYHWSRKLLIKADDAVNILSPTGLLTQHGNRYEKILKSIHPVTGTGMDTLLGNPFIMFGGQRIHIIKYTYHQVRSLELQ